MPSFEFTGSTTPIIHFDPSIIPSSKPQVSQAPPDSAAAQKIRSFGTASIHGEPLERHPEIAARVKKYPKALCNFVNFTKIVWAIPWTVIRITIVVVGILPIALVFYTIMKIVKATIGIFQALSKPQSNEGGPEIRTSSNEPKRALCPDAHRLEEFKIHARKYPAIRQQYYNWYSDHVNTLFSVDGLAARIGRDNVNPELVEYSRESYVNMHLVYRFDGPGMVGQTIQLMHRGDDGWEEVVTYQVDRYFEDDHGLVGYGLRPTDSDSAPPRLIFRGTNRSSYVDRHTGQKIKPPTGLETDMAGKIGRRTYRNQQTEIAEWLQIATSNGERKAFVSGHSLGGAITMRVGADYPQYVGKIFTLNAPKIDKRAINPYADYSHMNIKHVVMTGDKVVPNVGGVLLTNGQEGDEIIRIRGGNHTSKVLNDYCMREMTAVSYRPLPASVHVARSWFWSFIMNFIRPNINFI